MDFKHIFNVLSISHKFRLKKRRIKKGRLKMAIVYANM